MVGHDAPNFERKQEDEPVLYDLKPTYESWLTYGVKMGWCGPAVCYTHDGLPTTPAEEDEWNEGHDPCIHIIRMYEDDSVRQQVEDNHSPSTWRKSGQIRS
jgi:hypothetical protein